MNQRGIIIHISGQDTGKQDRVVSTLSKTLRDRDYSLVELLERHTRETLDLADDDLLARIIGWASDLLTNTGILILVSVSASLNATLTTLPWYVPSIELAIEGEFATSASHRLHVTGEAANLPQEIAQVILILETEMMAGPGFSPAGEPANADVYSAEEETLIQEHLRSLGYL
jgi:hypothetical protein